MAVMLEGDRFGVNAVMSYRKNESSLKSSTTFV
jgi:hypothetical protein